MLGGDGGGGSAGGDGTVGGDGGAWPTHHSMSSTWRPWVPSGHVSHVERYARVILSPSYDPVKSSGGIMK